MENDINDILENKVSNRILQSHQPHFGAHTTTHWSDTQIWLYLHKTSKSCINALWYLPILNLLYKQMRWQVCMSMSINILYLKFSISNFYFHLSYIYYIIKISHTTYVGTIQSKSGPKIFLFSYFCQGSVAVYDAGLCNIRILWDLSDCIITRSVSITMHIIMFLVILCLQ